MKWQVAILAGMIVLGSMLANAYAYNDLATDIDEIAVLFDYGNGRVQWVDLSITDDMSAFNATVKAAETLGISLDYIQSEYGIFILGINEIENNWPFEYWHLWVWNSTCANWQLSATGADALRVDGLKAVAWSYVMDRMDWSTTPPDATPDNRYPWTSFRHDLFNTGESQGIALLEAEKIWELNLESGAIDSSLIVSGNRIYVSTAGVYNWSEFEYDCLPQVFCLNFSGDILWRSELNASGYQISTPVVAGDMIVVASTDGQVYSFSKNDGSLMWKSNISYTYLGITSSPIFYRNQIILGGGDGTVYSFAENGSLLWSTKIASSIYFSSPAARNGIIYIGSEDGKLHAIYANGTGELWNATIGGKVRSAPALTDDMIIVTYAAYEGFVAVDGGVVALAYNGEELWRVDVNATTASVALCNEGIVVTSSDGISLISIDGALKWKKDLRALLKGSPSVAGNIIYVTTYNESEIYALDLNGDVLWQIPLDPVDYSMCSPTITDTMVLVSSDNGYIYAFSTPSSPENDGANGERSDLLLIVAAVVLAVIVVIGAVLFIRSRKKGKV
ncbi:MAG: PQQ-binding-like beta-propeller repeat protein [Methanomassiliicoccales archaeon]